MHNKAMRRPLLHSWSSIALALLTIAFLFNATDGLGQRQREVMSTGGTGGGSAPGAPTNLAAVPYSSDVSLAWSPSSGATSYTAYRSTTNGSGYSAIKSGLTTTSYSDSSAVNGTTYYYVVTATNSYGSSGNSNQASATPEPTPSVPTSLVAG